jgi:hypothetical protein
MDQSFGLQDHLINYQKYHLQEFQILKMIHFQYKGLDVNPGMYTLEWIDADGNECIETDSSIYAYQKLLIKAYDLQVDGFIVYCITRTRQKIVKGIPIKRGVKRKNERTDAIGKGFRSQIIDPPARMYPIA